MMVGGMVGEGEGGEVERREKKGREKNIPTITTSFLGSSINFCICFVDPS